MAFKVPCNTKTSQSSLTKGVIITAATWCKPCFKILKSVRTIVPIKFLLCMGN